MSRKQSFLKAVVVWGVAATVTIALSIQLQSVAQSPATEGSTTAPTLESVQGFQRVFSLSGHTNDIVSLAISPDGQTLVSGSNDKTIKLWNLKTGQLLYTLTGHSDSVSALAISSDGQTLVSASDDLTIKLWNLKTKKLLRTLLCISHIFRKEKPNFVTV